MSDIIAVRLNLGEMIQATEFKFFSDHSDFFDLNSALLKTKTRIRDFSNLQARKWRKIQFSKLTGQ